MSENEQWKKYPDKILEEFELTKSQEYFFIKLKSELEDSEVESFLQQVKETTSNKFIYTAENTSVPLALSLSIQDGWVIPAKGLFPIDQTIWTFEQDERVDTASPIYFRKELNFVHGFTFKDEILIKFDEKVETEKLEALCKDFQVEILETIGQNMFLLRVLNKKEQNTYEAAQKLRDTKIAMVQYSRVNWTQLSNHSCAATNPNDLYFATKQWNLKTIKTPEAWGISKGSPLIVIAILDTGCNLNHPDLKFQLVQKERMFDATNLKQSPTDNNGHGTLCAGIASAQTNSIAPSGVAGAGWNCRIMPIRINSNGSIDEASILRALRFARCSNEQAGSQIGWSSNKRAHIISMSWIWLNARRAIEEELYQCYQANITMFAAAGNRAGALPDQISYPACSKYVIAVGASNQNENRCTNSNPANMDWPGSGGGGQQGGSQYGNELSLVAPGVHISGPDLIGQVTAETYKRYKSMGIILPNGMFDGWNNLYDFLDHLTNQTAGTIIGDTNGEYYFEFYGTSAATPHAAGVAGLMLAYYPNLTPSQIRTILESTADKVGAAAYSTMRPNGTWNKFMGYGRINAKNAMENVVQNYPLNPANLYDVYIRNSLNDTGTEPDTNPFNGNSPDIMLNSSTSSGSVNTAKDNYLYVRVHNKGTNPSDVHVRLYLAPLGNLIPSQWKYLNQYDFYKIPSGGNATSKGILWAKADMPTQKINNFCIIASIEGVHDTHPYPDPAVVTDAAQFDYFMAKHNNICYLKLT